MTCFILRVLLSWISPYGLHHNPAGSLLTSLTEPLLRPARRLIPAIGGLDLSPLFLLIGLQALMMILPTRSIWSALLCANSVVPVL